MSERIGFVGLGNMGTAMAERLLAAGHTLRVYNRSRDKAAALAERGAHVANAPGETVAPGGIVITMLANDAALEHVTRGADGLLDRLGTGGIHLSMSTVAPTTAERLAEAHRQRGSIYLAAPVLGRPDAAAAGTLSICLAGEPAAKARVRPLLEAMGQGIFDYGDQPPAANVVKLATNFLLVSAMEALAEAFTFIEKQGVAPADVNAMWGQTLFACRAYQGYGSAIVERRFTPAGFALALGLKDVSLALDAAGRHTVPMPLASLVQNRLLAAVANGRAEMDWSALALGVAEDAGISR